MSILSKLFGGAPKEPAAPEFEDYKEFRIFVEPMKEGSSYRLAARIELDADGTVKTHQVIRADTFGDLDEAKEVSLLKAKQVIDQMGERLFSS